MLVAQEVAEQEFERFADAMALDVDESFMDEEDRKGFRAQKRRFVKAVQDGSLVINDDGEAVYTPQNAKSKYKEPIIFHERTGATLRATDGKKKNHDAERTYAMIADMCKIPASAFAGMVGADIKTCEAIFILLMA